MLIAFLIITMLVSFWTFYANLPAADQPVWVNMFSVIHMNISIICAATLIGGAIEYAL